MFSNEYKSTAGDERTAFVYMSQAKRKMSYITPVVAATTLIQTVINPIGIAKGKFDFWDVALNLLATLWANQSLMVANDYTYGDIKEDLKEMAKRVKEIFYGNRLQAARIYSEMYYCLNGVLRLEELQRQDPNNEMVKRNLEFYEQGLINVMAKLDAKQRDPRTSKYVSLDYLFKQRLLSEKRIQALADENAKLIQCRTR